MSEIKPGYMTNVLTDSATSIKDIKIEECAPLIDHSRDTYKLNNPYAAAGSSGAKRVKQSIRSEVVYEEVESSGEMSEDSKYHQMSHDSFGSLTK